MSATASSSASVIALAAAALIHSRSADHQWRAAQRSSVVQTSRPAAD
jgi:hypothetical protein